ncbi:MAG: hypothetical protein FJ403_14445 [Verrucomicrobia bacterium]|nr:hypothetical protein [Verrucomicrobiota bacterium]
MSGTASTNEYRWTFGVRAIASQIDRATLRTTLTYRVVPRLTLGVEYNPLASDVNPLANWLIIQEKEHQPALIAGTSSDRIGTPHGQSFYTTLSKSLEPEIGLPIAPYAGVSYGTFEDRFRPIAGANLELPHRFSAQVLFDGVHVHPILSYSQSRHVFSLILVRGKDPGLSYSISF